MNKVSIIIIADSYAGALERNLPGVLAQQYEPGYEVVVVCESKKGEAADVLTPLMAEHPNLRSTYIPDKPQYISGAEVAIMLATKAVQNDTIVMIHPKYEVPSENWLNEVAGLIANCQLSIGTPNYSGKRNFLSRYLHRRRSFKELKPWLNDNTKSISDLLLDKTSRSLINVAYSKALYLSEPDVRQFIYKYTTP